MRLQQSYEFQKSNTIIQVPLSAPSGETLKGKQPRFLSKSRPLSGVLRNLSAVLTKSTGICGLTFTPGPLSPSEFC